MYNPDYCVVSEEHDRLIEEIDKLRDELADSRGQLIQVQKQADEICIERNELIAYIGVLEQFVSQYKPGPMLMDGRPECLKDVLPTPTGSGEW